VAADIDRLPLLCGVWRVSYRSCFYACLSNAARPSRIDQGLLAWSVSVLPASDQSWKVRHRSQVAVAPLDVLILSLVS
jgi:hypothetical protein